MMRNRSATLESNGYPCQNTGISRTIPKCNCCPFGYHMDLDFVRFCEVIAKSTLSESQKQRRDRRRQRKSIEFMLGIDQQIDLLAYQSLSEIPQETEDDDIDDLSQRKLNNWNKLEYKVLKSSPSVTPPPPPRRRYHTINECTINSEKSFMLNQQFGNVLDDFERTLEYSSIVTSSPQALKTSVRSTDDEDQQALVQNEKKYDCVPVSYDERNSKDKRNSTVDEPYTKTSNSYEIKTLQRNFDNQRQNGEVNKEALQTIREQMLISLNRTRTLETEIKQIPKLLEQIKDLKEENRELELELKRVKNFNTSDQRDTRTSSPFTPPLRVSPVTLTQFKNKIINRDIGTSCIPPTRDTGCSPQPQVKLISIGTETITKIYSDSGTQTQSDIELYKNKYKSIGILVKPSTYDVSVQNKCDSIDASTETNSIPRPRLCSIGISVKPTTTEKKTSTSRINEYVRSIGIGTDPTTEIINPVKLTNLDRPPPSINVLNSVGSQTSLTSKELELKLIEKSMEHIGTQSLPIISFNKSSQSTSQKTSTANTDTIGLINFNDKLTNTNIVNVRNSTTNTITNIMMEQGTNTKSITTNEIGCGNDENIVQVIDNKPQSRIPRPKTLASPRMDRKFTRQNTYTVVDDHNDLSTSRNDDFNEVEHLKIHDNYARLRELDNINESTNVIASTININKIITTIKKDLDSEFKFDINNEAMENALPWKDEMVSKCDEKLSVFNSERIENKIDGNEYNNHEQKIRNKMKYETMTNLTNENLLKQIENIECPRVKLKPNKEILAALKVINDSLQKSQKGQQEDHLKNANAIVQKEWFNISSTDKADPHSVEDYIDYFEEFSNQLLRYVVNMNDPNGNTCMHYAVSHGNFDIVSILLDSKVCNVNQTNNAGYTCVMLVSLAKLKVPSHRTVVQRLFQLSDVNARAKKHNQTALMLAVSHGNIDMVQMLLEAGADINIQDEDGSTALMCAAEHGRIDIVKLLLANPECDSTIQDMDGSTALKISLDAGCRDIGVLLYAHEHMSRNKSPFTSLRRPTNKKSKGGQHSLRSPASTPSSPSPSIKFNYN